ncbi:MAG: VWA domain-containing protein, partial [Deltaproteobacteria bacterium]|nr:VWA domain-containing protein [Deltaproteobacteria bacterium]
FYTEHPGDRYLRLDVTCEKADIEFEGRYERCDGELRHEVDYGHECYRVHGPRHELSDIPQFAGRTLWTARWVEGEGGAEVSVSLEPGPALSPLKKGDALGGILLRNVPFGSARALPEFDGDYEYPGFTEASMEGDRTPTGEAVFWLPPGLWKLQVDPRKQENITYLESHMIPVQAGRTTIVDWPPSLAEAFVEEGTGRLEILKAGADEGKGVVEISLVGEERKKVVPTPENLTVTESGAEAKVLSVEPLKTPLEVTLLLDSSGSMKGQMKKALKAAARFIKGLPGDARITVIDFDTRPRRLPGKSKKDLLAALKKVRAGGATALYDSILMGLETLRGKNRPALVVFTDGVDANFNDTGPGSKATQEEVLAGVQGAGIPVFTIGFGEKSDVDTLKRIASLGGGAYYRARDLGDLEVIFDRIARNLGNQYRVVFERPRRAQIADIPVMSLVIDNSGSMDKSPENEGCDYRIEKVRQTLRSFVTKLPEDFLAQIMTFTDECTVRQVLTRDKTALIRALSLMRGEGGTDILNSVRTALLTLKAVPSSRRYLVYLTDAALRVDEEQEKEFDVLLGQLRDARIRCLWLGMVDEDKDGVFAHAADRTGGRFVISTRPEEVARVFRELASSIQQEVSEEGRTTLRVVLSHHNPDGENTLYSAAREVDFPRAALGGEIAAPEAVTWKIGPPLRPYDPEIARSVSGEDRVGFEVQVTKRIPLDFTAVNKAVRFRLREALFLSRLRGIDAPDGFRYLALTLSLENILPSQRVAVYPDGSNHPAAWVKGGGEPLRYEERVPTYLIPDLKRHLFLRWNNERSYPVSEITWLAEAPLILPGETALAVEPGEPVEGTILFMVPSENMRQASLHFYDTRYGHLDLPISGIMAPKEKGALERLPTREPTRLSDAFSFRVTGYEDLTKIDTVEAGDDCLFRVVRGVFTSKLQAHLNVHPAERFLLRLPTPKGSFFFRLHPVTGRIPLGYYRPTLFTPGSSNPVRLVFRIPKELADTGVKGEIVVDLRGGSVAVPLGNPLPPDRLPQKPDAEGEGVEVVIHRAGPIEDISGLGSRLVAVEATIRDKGGRGHARVGELIVLKNKNRAFDPEKAAAREKELERLRHEAAMLPHRSLANFAASVGTKDIPGLLFPLSAEDTLIFGMDGNTVIPAGHTRRGIFFFSIPEDTQLDDWAVGSLMLPKLSRPLSNEAVDDGIFRIARLDVEDSLGSSFWEEVEEKVEALMARRRVLDFRRPGGVRAKKVGLEGGVEGGEYIPPPAMTLAGREDLKSLKNLGDLKKRLSGCRWLPSKGSPWAVRYCPEAVLTQNWGTESDFARLAEIVLNRQGIRTERVIVKLTEKGRQTLVRLAGLEKIAMIECPGLRYRDAEGRERVLVAPFMKNVRELQGLVDYRVKPVEDEQTEVVGISVDFIVRPKGKGREQQMRELSGALAGGGEEEETVTVLTASLKVPDLSRGAFDIGYTKAPGKGRILYKAVLDGPSGRIVTDDESAVDTSAYQVLGCAVQVDADGDTFRRVMRLKENTDITGVFHTLGINLPDLPGYALAGLEQARRRFRRQIPGRPDALSALRWYARGVLARFIAAQTRYEEDLEKTLGLVTGRTSLGRCIMVTLVKPEGETPLETTMDLIRPFNEIHRSPDPRAARAFNILSGLASARFEASALSGEAKGLFQIWNHCPEGTRLIAVDSENQEDFLRQLKERKYPEPIIRHLTETDRIVLFPSRPAFIHGKPRWAWLEVDPETYRVVAVLDTGAQGAILESLIGNLYEQATSYLVGALVGIDVSIWSVAAFSLELEDYGEIVKAARKFAEDLGKNFSLGGDSAGMGVGGKPGVSLGRAVQFELDPSGVSMGNNLLGFGNGYNDGVAYYFQHAK